MALALLGRLWYHSGMAQRLTKTQKANLRKWVDALESGRYRQTREKLCGKYGYCCLGVWCAESGQGVWSDLLDNEHQFILDHDWYSCELPTVLKESLGISGDQENRYIGLNDISKANFKRIAQEIRKDFPEVFAS